MELSPSDIERNMRQFNRLALRVLQNAANKGHNEYRKRANREVLFSEIPESDLEKLFVVDQYMADELVFDVLGFEIVVKDPVLAEALEHLPENRRNIILMKYFLQWTDKKIGEALAIQRATIQYQRAATLKMLKELLEEGQADE